MHTPTVWFEKIFMYSEMFLFEQTELVLGVPAAPWIALLLSGAGQ